MDLFREPARWMVAIDDRILETLSVYGGLKIYPLHHRLASEGRVDPPVSYVLLRCKRLRTSGLLTQQDGYFVLTDAGERYLAGDVDAATLGPDADPTPDDRGRPLDDARDA